MFKNIYINKKKKKNIKHCFCAYGQRGVRERVRGKDVTGRFFKTNFPFGNGQFLNNNTLNNRSAATNGEEYDARVQNAVDFFNDRRYC